MSSDCLYVKQILKVTLKKIISEDVAVALLIFKATFGFQKSYSPIGDLSSLQSA